MGWVGRFDGAMYDMGSFSGVVEAGVGMASAWDITIFRDIGIGAAQSLSVSTECER